MDALVNVWTESINGFAEGWWRAMAIMTAEAIMVMALAIAVLWIARRAPSAWRYGLLLIVLFKFALLPVGANPFGLFHWFFTMSPPQASIASPAAIAPAQQIAFSSQPAEPSLPASAARDVEAPVRSNADRPVARPAPSSTFSPRVRFTPFAWGLIVQVLGSALMLVLIARRVQRFRSLTRSMTPLTDGPLHAAALDLAPRMGLRRLPRMLVGRDLASPQAGGLLRPFVVVPEWALDASADDQHSLIAHEFAHLRRRDPWIVWVQLLMQAWQWWNPALLLLNRRIRIEREFCCDDLVLGLGLAREDAYSRMLVDVAERMRGQRVSLEMAGLVDAFQSLKRRIRRVLDTRMRRPARISFVSLATLLLFAAFVLPGGPALVEASPAQTATATPSAAVPSPMAAAAPVTGQLTGTVKMPDGSPAAGATVQALSWSNWHGPVATTTANAQGSFTMTAPRGTYWFLIRSGNFRDPIHTEVVINKEGHASATPRITLELGTAVTGTVIEEATGEPVTGAQIITDEGDTAVSDAGGKFHIEGIARKDHSIRAVKKGFAYPTVYFDTTAHATAEVKMTMKPGGTVRGRVTNEKGEPIAKATVRDHYSGSIFIVGAGNTETDADGNYVLTGYRLDTPLWSFGVEAPGYAQASRTNVQFPADTHEVRVDFQLTPGGATTTASAASGAAAIVATRTITGRVADTNGAPIAGALVAYGSSTSYVGYRTAKSDAQGNYKIEGAGTRDDLLVAQAKGFAPGYLRNWNANNTGADFKLEAGRTIDGQVVDERGTPLSGVHVSVMGSPRATSSPVRADLYRYLESEATSDAVGHFRLENLGAGEIPIDAVKTGSSSLREYKLKNDGSQPTLSLTGAGALAGTVLSAADGQPVKDFKVYLSFPQKPLAGEEHGGGFAAAYSTTGVSFIAPDGTFAVSGIDQGRHYRMSIDATGYQRTSLDLVAVQPAAHIDFHASLFMMQRSQAFGGTILDAKTGAPLAGVEVKLLDTDGRADYYFSWNEIPREMRPVSATTSASGQFNFASAPVARGMVAISKPGYGRVLLKDVDCAQPLSVKLEHAASMQGTAAEKTLPPPLAGMPSTGRAGVAILGGTLPAAASAAAGLEVEVSSQGIGFGSVPVDAQGHFEFTDLPPGSYVVHARKDFVDVGIAHVDLKAEDKLDIEKFESPLQPPRN